MQPVNMKRAQASLSHLVESIERGREREIVTERSGRPVAKLVPVDAAPASQHIGVAKGKFEVPDCIDAHNFPVTNLFLGRQKP